MTVEIISASEAMAEINALGPKPRWSPHTMTEAAKAWTLYEHAMDGSYLAKAHLQEALTRSDFPKYFGAALDAKLLAAYQAISPVWQEFAARDVGSDFRDRKWVDLLGGQGALSLVGEGAPYPRRALSEADGSYKVAKFGDTFGLTWEMLIDDRLGGFRTLPDRLAVAAREMEDRIATGLLTDGDGPNTALFSATAAKGKGGAAVSTLLSGNPELSEDAVADALLAISTRVDYDGRPVVLKGTRLVVPPALQMTAERIVEATEVEETVGTTKIRRRNPLAGKLRVVVNPWLQVLDANANAAKSWYVMPDPTGIVNRPAGVLGFLAGHETPDLRVRNDQGNRVGGGSIAAEEGSFELDTIDYRVRHVLGAGSVDAIQVAYSSGAGS